MKNYVYIAESLDGFIADANNSVDWLNEIPNPDGDDYGFSDFMQNIDAIVMGRRTFETVQSFGIWPYEKPVIVLSKSIDKLPEKFEGKATVSKDDIDSLLKRLYKKGYKRLYIDGGKVIQSFLNLNLIDEMIITRIPILLGDGVRLFGKLKQKMKFKQIGTKVLDNGLTTTTYHRIRNPLTPIKED